MSTYPKFTSRDLESLPEVEGTRYEIIDGELFVSKQPSWEHQFAASEISRALQNWSHERRLGWSTQVPGLVFAEDDDVVPDVVWISHERLANGLDSAGHLTVAPELVVEVLSPGTRNERRDRDSKLGLYSRRGVREYWIVDGFQREVLVFRQDGTMLRLAATLTDTDVLQSPMLPGFACPVVDLWWPPPSTP
jgi:Uma2 family endonuclease